MIFYFGKDQQLIDKMSAYYRSNKLTCNNKVKSMPLEMETIIETMMITRPNCMIFDLSRACERIIQTFVLLNYLRKNREYRGIPLVGIFSSKNEVEKYSSLFSLGLLYPFIKGSEEKIFFDDVHYLSFEEQTPFSKFAYAKLNELPYRLRLQGRTYGFTDNSVLIESDLQIPEGKLLGIKLNIIEGFKELELRSQQHFEQGITCNYMARTEFEIPFFGPWDDPESNLIHKDSYDTWLQDCEKVLKNKRGRILIVTTRPQDYLLSGKLALQSLFDIYVTSTFEEASRYIESYSMDVVYYRLDSTEETLDEDGENNFENLYRLTNASRNLHGGSLIYVAFNSPSKSMALKKALEYENIVAVHDDIDEHYLLKFSRLFEEKGDSKSCYSHCYDLGENLANAELFLDVEVTSITEHELTFYCNEEIPMYSLLRIEIPADLYLLIVPPFRSLEQNNNGKHYMGFLLGGTETDSELIRSFVNRAVVEGLEVFSNKAIIDEPEDSEHTLKTGLEEINTILAETEKREKKVDSDRIEVIRKTPINGKTKL